MMLLYVSLQQLERCAVSVLHGRKLFDLAPKPKWFIPVDDADHTDFIDRMGRSRYEETLLFFVRSGRLDLDKEVKVEHKTP